MTSDHTEVLLFDAESERDRFRERAEAAEAKLAEIGALCRDSAVSAWGGATPVVAAERILAITGTEGDGDRG